MSELPTEESGAQEDLAEADGKIKAQNSMVWLEMENGSPTSSTTIVVVLKCHHKWAALTPNKLELEFLRSLLRDLRAVLGCAPPLAICHHDCPLCLLSCPLCSWDST